VSGDWQPLTGPLSGVNGLFRAFGFSGHGYKLCPAVGALIAYTVLGRESPASTAPSSLPTVSPRAGKRTPPLHIGSWGRRGLFKRTSQAQFVAVHICPFLNGSHKDALGVRRALQFS
jgi:hypothetical protein